MAQPTTSPHPGAGPGPGTGCGGAPQAPHHVPGRERADELAVPGVGDVAEQGGEPLLGTGEFLIAGSARRIADGPGGEPRFHYLVRWRDHRRIEHARMFATEGDAAAFDSDIRAGML
jgi:hypothetical protein